MKKLPQPTWRKPAGIFLVLLLIAVWAVVTVTIAELISDVPWPAHMLFFIAAGIVWILPLKPLLRWMETGTWRGGAQGPVVGPNDHEAP